MWPSLLDDAAQQRLFQELTLNPDLLPSVPATSGSSGADGDGGSNGSGNGNGNGSGSRESEEVAAAAAAAAAGKWMQRPIQLFGKEILQPRLTCFYGLKGVTYRYILYRCDEVEVFVSNTILLSWIFVYREPVPDHDPSMRPSDRVGCVGRSIYCCSGYWMLHALAVVVASQLTQTAAHPLRMVSAIYDINIAI